MTDGSRIENSWWGFLVQEREQGLCQQKWRNVIDLQSLFKSIYRYRFSLWVKSSIVDENVKVFHFLLDIIC